MRSSNPKKQGGGSRIKEAERVFFKQVPQSLIKLLYYYVYKTDFELLGYAFPQEYINMGHM